jgi:hypothetical protein
VSGDAFPIFDSCGSKRFLNAPTRVEPRPTVVSGQTKRVGFSGILTLEIVVSAACRSQKLIRVGFGAIAAE